jgi:hypothetical protein
VKLLFDENLSPRLVGALAEVYPGSAHVHHCGLGSADDSAIWQYAREKWVNDCLERLGLSRTKYIAGLSPENHMASFKQLHLR